MRIAISGIGVVSPFGVGRQRFWEHVRAGCSATRTFVPEPGMAFLDQPCRVAAPVPELSAADLPVVDGDAGRDPRNRADPKRYSRAALIAVIAARDPGEEG